MTDRQNVIHFGLRSPQVWAATNVASQDRGGDRHGKFVAVEGQN